MRWVAACAVALFMFVVGGGETPFVGSPTSTSVVISTTAPTPSSTTSVDTSTSTSTTTSTTTTTSTSTSTTTTLAPVVKVAERQQIDNENARCPEWWQLALEVGWTEDQLSTLDRVMWNETRCIPDLISSTNDFGLVQINRHVWKETVEQHGWTMNDLLIPRNGLAMGLIVYEAAEAMGWCGWQPWYRSGSYCA